MEKERIDVLVRRAQNGDLQAMEQLLEAAHTPVSYQCRKMMSRPEDAQDLTQEILLAVYQNIGKLEEPKAFWSWLNRITATRCMNALTRTHVDLQFAEDEEGHSILDDLEETDEQSIPDKAIDNAETARMIDEIVSNLPEAQRLSTLMYYYDEMSIKEIAQIMGVSENTVKSRLKLARKAIEEKVLDYEKQGVKLYSVSVLPFLWYFLRNAAKTEANAAAATACTSSVMAAGAATVTGTATAVAVTGSAATSAVATGLVAKIVAGCLAVAIAVGGTAVYLRGEDPTEPTEETSVTAGSEPSGTTTPETSETTVPQPSLNDLAMEAYDDLLRRGYTDDSMPIYYYTYLDIDQDGLDELIVADNKGTPDAWTSCELYSYDESGLIFCGSNSARYEYFYHVNGTYLMGTYRWGEVYLSTSGEVTFEGTIDSSEIIELQETPYNAFDIGITEAEILQIFYDAKDFYDIQIYGKRSLDSAYYSVSDFDWIEGVIEYNGGLYAPCDEYTYDEFVQKLQSLFTPDVVNTLIEEVGLLEYNGKCYTYIREGVGDPILGDYEVSAQLKGNVVFEIQISFTDLDGSSVTEYIYCQKENDLWVLDGSYFYGA